MRGWLQNGWPAGSGSGSVTSSTAPGQRAAVERREDIGFDQMRATPDIDKGGTTRQAREQIGIQDAARLVGQRQQTDEDGSAFEEGR